MHILTVEDSVLANALQRHADVILQKSVREGFGLTATEAMWKGTAVTSKSVDHASCASCFRITIQLALSGLNSTAYPFCPCSMVQKKCR